MNTTTDDVRQWLRTLDGQIVTPELVQDLVETLESALDFIDGKKAEKPHPLYER